MPQATDRVHSRTQDRAHSRNAPFLAPFLAPGFGPGTDNLQLLLDYENWTAGDPLPNEYTDNSGITTLADNNTVQEETSTPQIGTKSGKYQESNSEYHSHADDAALQIGGATDIYISAWVRFNTLPSAAADDQMTLVSHLNFSNDQGYLLNWQDSLDDIRWVVGDGSPSFTTTIPDTDWHFWEAWYLSATQDQNVRLDDGATESLSPRAANPSAATGENFEVGKYNKGTRYLDADVDQLMVEIAPQGNLFWPNHPTWLYNGGAGRTTNEILTYDP